MMSDSRKVLIVEENSFVPLDVRVWYEATTLRDAGWRVTVICPEAKDADRGKELSRATGTPEDLDGVTVYRFPLTFAEHGVFSYLGEYLSAFISIAGISWRVWRDGHFDIVHFCNPPDIFFPMALFFRLLGARAIFDHHDLFPEFVASRYHGLTGRLLYVVARITEYLSFRIADAVISTNDSYRQIAKERGGVPEDRVVVVRNGPRIDEFVPVEPVHALRRGFPYMACYAGVMGPEDGVLELIESIRYIVHDLGRRDILFVLLGDGGVRPHALAKVEAWGLESFVDMPGMIHDKLRLRQYMSTADVLLSPEPLTPLNAKSTFIKIGEYMAMSKPIVAYNLDETRQTAQEAAIYAEPGNIEEFGQAVVTLLHAPERRRRMGETGRQRILNHLGWEHQQKDLLRVYAIASAQKVELYDR
jgi:glycosyltransferase involved in cell wall biosynthesis